MKNSNVVLNHSKCDICGADPEFIFDCPTVYAGKWGHLCPECYPTNAQSTAPNALGTKHRNRPLLAEEKPKAESFPTWMQRVEAKFEAQIGLDIDSILGDWNSRDMYDEGTTVSEAVVMLKDQCQSEFGDMISELIG